MKTRDAVFILIVAGVLLGAMFMIPSGGFPFKKKKITKLTVKTQWLWFLDILIGKCTLANVEVFAAEWRETFLGLTVGEQLLLFLYSNPLIPQILPFPEVYDTTIIVRDTVSGATWHKKVTVTIPAWAYYYQYAIDVEFDKIPAGNYRIDFSVNYVYEGPPHSPSFTLSEDQTGRVFSWGVYG